MKRKLTSMLLVAAIAATTIACPVFAEAPEKTVQEMEGDHYDTSKPQGLHEGTQIEGRISPDFEKDFYKYNPSKNGYVSFTFTAPRDGYTYKVAVLADNGKTKLWSGSVKDSTVTTAQFDQAPEQGYYITVTTSKTQGLGSTKNYTLYAEEVELAGVETENNGTLGSADKIKANKSHWGMILNKKDTDYFKFKATKTGTYKIYFQNYEGQKTGKNWNVNILNKKGKNILKKTDVSKFNYDIKLKKGQTIYVKVGSKNSDAFNAFYRIRIYKAK